MSDQSSTVKAAPKPSPPAPAKPVLPKAAVVPPPKMAPPVAKRVTPPGTPQKVAPSSKTVAPPKPQQPNGAPAASKPVVATVPAPAKAAPAGQKQTVPAAKPASTGANGTKSVAGTPVAKPAGPVQAKPAAVAAVKPAVASGAKPVAAAAAKPAVSAPAAASKPAIAAKPQSTSQKAAGKDTESPSVEKTQQAPKTPAASQPKKETTAETGTPSSKQETKAPSTKTVSKTAAPSKPAVAPKAAAATQPSKTVSKTQEAAKPAPVSATSPSKQPVKRKATSDVAEEEADHAPKRAAQSPVSKAPVSATEQPPQHDTPMQPEQTHQTMAGVPLSMHKATYAHGTHSGLEFVWPTYDKVPVSNDATHVLIVRDRNGILDVSTVHRLSWSFTMESEALLALVKDRDVPVNRLFPLRIIVPDPTSEEKVMGVFKIVLEKVAKECNTETVAANRLAEQAIHGTTDVSASSSPSENGYDTIASMPQNSAIQYSLGCTCPEPVAVAGADKCLTCQRALPVCVYGSCGCRFEPQAFAHGWNYHKGRRSHGSEWISYFVCPGHTKEMSCESCHCTIDVYPTEEGFLTICRQCGADKRYDAKN
jgi:hypothetical protein